MTYHEGRSKYIGEVFKLKDCNACTWPRRCNSWHVKCLKFINDVCKVVIYHLQLPHLLHWTLKLQLSYLHLLLHFFFLEKRTSPVSVDIDIYIYIYIWYIYTYWNIVKISDCLGHYDAMAIHIADQNAQVNEHKCGQSLADRLPSMCLSLLECVTHVCVHTNCRWNMHLFAGKYRFYLCIPVYCALNYNWQRFYPRVMVNLNHISVNIYIYIYICICVYLCFTRKC